MMYDRPKLRKGQRVEVPVHYDAWIRGARFGTVTGFRQSKPGYSAFYFVRLDHPAYRNSLKLWEHDVPYCKVMFSEEVIRELKGDTR